ncbi:MAG: thioredoxin [Kordiimonadaceae bacterium]|jgi:putative thioredoxin|nr:thioredoxin [Kordiimonadaceae bacterium]MBT6329762.1 thioredoxin [Kordiimonadaceae bacterium]
MQEQVNNSNIIDVDMSNFVAQVIEKSSQVPVIVDFWAPWCEPCKTLGPTLEKLVNEADGAVILAKINIDENQEIAAQMQIRSVPTVVAFVEGRPVDAFAGVKPESEIRDFITKVAPDIGPSESEQMISIAADAYEQGNYEEAGSAYSQALQLDSENNAAIAGLASALIKLGDLENAGHVLSGAKDKNDPAVTAAQAALDTAEQIGDVGDLEELKKKVEKNADDYQARFDLAIALWATDARGEAADHLLYIIAADKDWQEDGARKQLVKFFEMAGPMDPFTVGARRKLSSLLYS